MTILDPISNPAALPVTLVPPGRRALTTAEKIRHTEPVPGTTDNDSDSWRKHQSDGLAANQEAIRHALARLDTLGTFIDEDGFAIATADQAAAGYAYEARVGQLPANNSLALVPANQSTAFDPAPTTTVVLYIRVPAGIDPDTVRLDHRRGTTLVASYPRAEDDWDPITTLTGRSPHYDYYVMVGAELGSVVGISGIERNDRFDCRIHGHDSAAPPVETLEVIPDDEDALPDVADHPDTKLILWRDQFYRKGQIEGSAGYAFSFRPGNIGAGIIGVSFGTFIVNPNGDFGGFENDGRELLMYIELEAYRTAKGSNEASGDALSVTLETDEDTPRTQTLVMTYRGGSVSHDGKSFIIFSGPRASTIMDAQSVGHLMTVALQRNSAAFMDIPENHEAWVPMTLMEVQVNARAIQDLLDRLDVEEHHSEAIRDEIQTLEHKTSRIGSDIQGSPWAATADNAGGLRLGQAFWRGNSGTTTFYLDSLVWNVFMTPTSHTISGEFDDVLLGFIATNNSTWRNVRMVIRDADGDIVTTFSPQNGRSAPQEAYDTISSIPDNLGDYTIRYMTNSDGTIHLLPRLRNNWTITIEERTSEDVPVWEGELADAFEHELEDLQKITADLHAGTVVESWGNATQNAQGGIAVSAADTPWTLANARALANNAFSLKPTGGFTDCFILVRVPAGTERASARAQIVYNNETGSRTYDEKLNHLHFLGSSADNAWDYYADPDIFGSIFEVQLQVTATSAHAGTSSFAGKVTGTIEDEATGDRLLPAYPAAGARNALVPKFSGDAMGYHPSISEQEELASRSALTGGWTIADANRFGVNGSVTQSGTTLRMDAKAALRSGTYGVIISIANTHGESKVFVPWSMFRTGSGTYVTGGGHGTQGVPVGYWNNNNNSEVVATCDWDSGNGRFELTLIGPTRTGVATVRVWSAQ